MACAHRCGGEKLFLEKAKKQFCKRKVLDAPSAYLVMTTFPRAIVQRFPFVYARRRTLHTGTMVKAHVECSSDLTWLLIQKQNVFVRRSRSATRQKTFRSFSSETNNLASLHSYKHSGACLAGFGKDTLVSRHLRASETVVPSVMPRSHRAYRHRTPRNPKKYFHRAKLTFPHISRPQASRAPASASRVSRTRTPPPRS